MPSIRSDGSAPSESVITVSTSAAATSEPASDGGERRAPHLRADRGRRRHERVQHDHRERRGQRELGEVERDLGRRAAADEQQHERRPGDLRDDQVLRRREQQAHDERQLRERERVRAAAEVGVDDEDLGHREGRGERPPRDVHAVGVRRQVAREREVQRRRGPDDQRDEQPDGRRAQAGGPAQLPSPLQSLPDHRRPDQRRPDHLRPDQRRPVQPFSPVPTAGAVALGLRAQVRPQRVQVQHGGRERLRRLGRARRRQRERARQVDAAGAVRRHVRRPGPPRRRLSSALTWSGVSSGRACEQQRDEART